MWIYRISGATLAAIGLAALVGLTWLLYTRSASGPIVLVRLGMPAALLIAMTGALLLSVGTWLCGFWHPAHGRPAR